MQLPVHAIPQIILGYAQFRFWLTPDNINGPLDAFWFFVALMLLYFEDGPPTDREWNELCELVAKIFSVH